MSITKVRCPLCGSFLVAEFVDVEVGMVQSSPYHCTKCIYVEPGCPSDSCIMTRCKSWDECGGRSKLFEMINSLKKDKDKVDDMKDEWERFRMDNPWTEAGLRDFVRKITTILKREARKKT